MSGKDQFREQFREETPIEKAGCTEKVKPSVSNPYNEKVKPVSNPYNRKRPAKPATIPQSPSVKVKREKVTRRQADTPINLHSPKKPNVQKYVKPLKDVEVVDLTRDPPISLSFMTVANGFYGFVFVRKTGTNRNARTSPITDVILDMKNGILDSEQREFLAESGLIAAVPLRKSKEVNEPIVNRGDNGKEYKEKCFVVSLENRTKEVILNAFVEFLCARNVEAGVTYPSDETNRNKQALDNYITDEAIIKLLKMTWAKPVDTKFYAQNESIVYLSFFSHPYPEAASRELGYPDKDSYNFTEDEMTRDI